MGNKFARKIAKARRLDRIEAMLTKHDLVLESIWEFFDKKDRKAIEAIAEEKAAKRWIVTDV